MQQVHEAVYHNRKGIIKRDPKTNSATAELFENNQLVDTITGYDYADDTMLPRPITTIVNEWVRK